MAFVKARNHVNGHVFANYELFESWRQLVEVMLHSLVQSDMKKGLKVAVLFELVQDLLLKVKVHVTYLHSFVPSLLPPIFKC